MMQSILRAAKSSVTMGTAVASRGLATAADHPWLSKVKGPASFTPEERVLTFLAGLGSSEA